MNRIKELRKERGLKQVDLCKTLGVSQAALSGYETGNYQPDNDILIKIADYFDTTVDYLLGKSDIKKPLTSEDMSGLTEKQIKILEMMSELPEQDQDDLIQQAEYRIWLKHQKESGQ